MGMGKKRRDDFTAIPTIQVKPFAKKPVIVFVRSSRLWLLYQNGLTCVNGCIKFALCGL